MFEVIVVDPDEKQWEGKNLGLFYAGTSRATTLGDPDGLNSAIYFQGTSMKESRVRNLTCKEGTNQEFTKVPQRRRWAQHLQTQATNSRSYFQSLHNHKQTLFEWAKSTHIDHDLLFQRIRLYQQRPPKSNV